MRPGLSTPVSGRGKEGGCQPCERVESDGKQCQQATAAAPPPPATRSRRNHTRDALEDVQAVAVAGQRTD
jgi:hypothetical protein